LTAGARHLARSAACLPSKHPAETAEVVATDREGRLGHVVAAPAQELGRTRNAHAEQIPVRGVAHLIAKESAEVEAAHPGAPGEIVDGERLGVRRMDSIECDVDARVACSKRSSAPGPAAQELDDEGLADGVRREQAPRLRVTSLGAEQATENHEVRRRRGHPCFQATRASLRSHGVGDRIDHLAPDAERRGLDRPVEQRSMRDPRGHEHRIARAEVDLVVPVEPIRQLATLDPGELHGPVRRCGRSAWLGTVVRPLADPELGMHLGLAT